MKIKICPRLLIFELSDCILNTDPEYKKRSKRSTPSSRTDHLRVTDPLSGRAKFGATAKRYSRLETSRDFGVQIHRFLSRFVWTCQQFEQMISFIPPAAYYQRCFAQTCPWQLYLWSVTTNKLNMRCVEISFRPKLQFTFVIKIFQYFSLKIVVFCDFEKKRIKSDILSTMFRPKINTGHKC